MSFACCFNARKHESHKVPYVNAARNPNPFLAIVICNVHKKMKTLNYYIMHKHGCQQKLAAPSEALINQCVFTFNFLNYCFVHMAFRIRLC